MTDIIEESSKFEEFEEPNKFEELEEAEIGKLTLVFIDILRTFKDYINNPESQIDVKLIKESFRSLCVMGEFYIEGSRILKGLVGDINNNVKICECIFKDRKEILGDMVGEEKNNKEKNNKEITTNPDSNMLLEGFSREACLGMLDYQINSYYKWKRQTRTDDDDNSEEDDGFRLN